MPVIDSPLRYPGGKSQLAPLVIELMRNNDLFYGEYIEPFAGGAGIACSLLLNGYVSRIHINDLDRSIYSFWWAILNEPERFCKRIDSIKVTIDQWRRQKNIQCESNPDTFALGFSTFFLNRTNRSGIITGGVIGGFAQDGEYLLDCRFNKKDLIRKIERIATHRDQICLTNLDARVFLNRINRRKLDCSLVNIDPPYYLKGPELYKNCYGPKDHELLAETVQRVKPYWMVTYDDTPQTRALYKQYPSYIQNLNYSAQVKRIGVELLVLDPRLKVPPTLSQLAKAA